VAMADPEDTVGFAEDDVELGKLWRTAPVMMSMTRDFKTPLRSNMVIDV
jgi:hypothetical protein